MRYAWGYWWHCWKIWGVEFRPGYVFGLMRMSRDGDFPRENRG